MKSQEFFEFVAPLVNLKPGTCGVYLRLSGFKPKAVMPGRRRIEHVYEKDQIEGAVQAIKDFQERRTA